VGKSNSWNIITESSGKITENILEYMDSENKMKIIKGEII